MKHKTTRTAERKEEQGETTVRRRTGDRVVIDGDYQHRAVTQGPVVQRFWHYTKQLSIREFLPPVSGDQVIDVGCGSGTVTSVLGSYGANVLGVDGNPQAIEFASRTYAGPNIKFQTALVDERFTTEVAVDKIYCLEVIEHIYLPQAETMLRMFHDLLKPQGKVLLSTPNYRSAWPLIEWFMDRSHLSPKMRAEQHVELYHPRKLRRVCEQCGFAVERMWTSCLLAPWLAPLSWRFAEKVHSFESNLPFALGSILLCVLVKPDSSIGSHV
jgi:2-polyprenyl-3-methyl-5-hydroxy-6-metoxy-1,4-benzoquinol methylase